MSFKGEGNEGLCWSECVMIHTSLSGLQFEGWGVMLLFWAGLSENKHSVLTRQESPRIPLSSPFLQMG